MNETNNMVQGAVYLDKTSTLGMDGQPLIITQSNVTQTGTATATLQFRIDGTTRLETQAVPYGGGQEPTTDQWNTNATDLTGNFYSYTVSFANVNIDASPLDAEASITFNDGSNTNVTGAQSFNGNFSGGNTTSQVFNITVQAEFTSPPGSSEYVEASTDVTVTMNTLTGDGGSVVATQSQTEPMSAIIQGEIQ